MVPGVDQVRAFWDLWDPKRPNLIDSGCTLLVLLPSSGLLGRPESFRLGPLGFFWDPFGLTGATPAAFGVASWVLWPLDSSSFSVLFRFRALCNSIETLQSHWCIVPGVWDMCCTTCIALCGGPGPVPSGWMSPRRVDACLVLGTDARSCRVASFTSRSWFLSSSDHPGGSWRTM